MADKLAAYNQKRDFLETREPPGSKAAGGDTGAGPLCFVVQHHLASRDHYDLRLEWNGTLLSLSLIHISEPTRLRRISGGGVGG